MAEIEQDRLWTVARVATRLLGVAVIGAILGLLVAVFTPAKVEIAGSDARVWLEFGRSYDQLGVAGVLTGKRATTRSVLGEPLGVRAELDLDASVLTDESGQFNVNILPAYIQAYSDPEQLVTDVRHAIVIHFLVFGLIGAAGAVALVGARRGYRAWRASYDRLHWPDRGTVARAYRAPERAVARWLAMGLILLVVIDIVPSGKNVDSGPTRVTGDAIFAGTPLAGVKVQGLLRPALAAVEGYIETYFDQTNDYYNQLRTTLESYLADHPVQLPSGDDVAQLGFVTDRHCNIGMDRVIVALLDHFSIHTLVSGGDDAFSGSFGFEAACTRNLADKTSQSGITDVFVGGNHDSAMTIADEDKQGIKTLTGDVVEQDGLRFVGLPDPRTSRYGQGIVPSARSAQDVLLKRQGTAAGKLGCSATAPLIAVLHDPLAGTTAMQQGCGHITVALDGHTHKEGEPVSVAITGGTGEQFTGGSAGGAPTESAVESSFASRLTVGPLNHDAWLNIVSIDRGSGALVGVTSFHFTPDQTITVTQQGAQ